MQFLNYVPFFIVISYSLFIVLLYIYWINKPLDIINFDNVNCNENEIKSIVASVVITVRNEEKNINDCLNSLLKQKLYSNKIEILISDDYSSDNTITQIKKIISTNENSLIDIKIIQPDDSNNGYIYGSKKQAQERAIKQAKGDIIILTDADCIFNEKWIISIISYLKNNDALFISAPVKIVYDNTLWSKIQSLEFTSLVISGAASIIMGCPLMSNAANIAFTKSAYSEIVDKIPSKHLLSGDDIFLMVAFTKKFGHKKIHFIKNYDTIVYTKPLPNFISFLSQRIRWSSKAITYKDFFQIFISFLVFLANASIILYIVLSLFSLKYITLLVSAFIVKLIVDSALIYEGLVFFNSTRLILLVLPLQIIYPFYVTIVPLLSLFVKVKWKGRSI
ncbi:MAG TPA: glycosyltransferase [Bacteroidales bacterium]|nr:glycosyltransferase [Bacteroidales bacterium]